MTDHADDNGAVGRTAYRAVLDASRLAAGLVLAASVIGFIIAAQHFPASVLLWLFGLGAVLIATPALIVLTDPPVWGEGGALCLSWGVLGASGAEAAELLHRFGGADLSSTTLTVAALVWLALPTVPMLVVVSDRLRAAAAVRN